MITKTKIEMNFPSPTAVPSVHHSLGIHTLTSSFASAIIQLPCGMFLNVCAGTKRYT